MPTNSAWTAVRARITVPASPSQTIADGGGRSTGGRVQLEGTIGQNAVGDPATGGLYELIPGFRRERGPVVDGVFADGFEGD